MKAKNTHFPTRKHFDKSKTEILLLSRFPNEKDEKCVTAQSVRLKLRNS